MIVDNIKNYKKYCSVHEMFSEAFEFIKRAEKEDLPVGRYEILGTEVYAMIQEYTPHNEAESKYEGHRKYIDIQYVLKGVEKGKIIDISKAKSIVDYNPEGDYEFFCGSDLAAEVVLESGDYGIYFPSDIHMPGVKFGDNENTVKKIVVKVLENN